MNQRTQSTIRSAPKTVASLVERCRKGGPLYIIQPKVVAHISRTGKWLLNAIAALNQELNQPATKETEK